MESLLVILVLQTAEKPEFDRSLPIRVNAENNADALVLAKKALKMQHPNFNLAKNWMSFVVGRPNRE
jgi:hypothetical protein